MPAPLGHAPRRAGRSYGAVQKSDKPPRMSDLWYEASDEVAIQELALGRLRALPPGRRQQHERHRVHPSHRVAQVEVVVELALRPPALEQRSVVPQRRVDQRLRTE